MVTLNKHLHQCFGHYHISKLASSFLFWLVLMPTLHDAKRRKPREIFSLNIRVEIAVYCKSAPIPYLIVNYSLKP